jgi:hypothetical protein
LAFKVHLSIFNQIKKQENMDYFDKYCEYNTLSARMAGYFSASALHNTEIPLKVRKEMLEFLIKSWTEVKSNSLVVQNWTQQWKKEVESLPI